MIYLHTERLIIRDHKTSDLESHHKIFSNKEVMHYIQDIKTNSIEESEKNLQICIDDIINPMRKYYFFRIESKNHHHVGEIGYTVTDFTPIGKLVEMGYFIFKEYWGKGYVTESVKEVMKFAFMENNVYRISATCFRENISSERVMINCGMIKEGEFIKKQWHDGQLKDRVYYRILRDEWLQLNIKSNTFQ